MVIALLLTHLAGPLAFGVFSCWRLADQPKTSEGRVNPEGTFRAVDGDSFGYRRDPLNSSGHPQLLEDRALGPGWRHET